MTDETEHDGAVDSASAENPEGADTGAKAPSSIIVDPSLTALTATAPVGDNGSPGLAEAAPEPAAAAIGGIAPALRGGAMSSAAAADQRLSDDDAERFAASIRPSWEPPIGKDYGDAATAAAPARANGGAGAALPVAAAPAEDEVRGLPGSERRRGVLITAGAVLGFAALAALGIATSHTDVSSASKPEKKAPAVAAKPAAQAAAPVRPEPQPAPPAAPAPAPAPADPLATSTAPALLAPVPPEPALLAPVPPEPALPAVPPAPAPAASALPPAAPAPAPPAEPIAKAAPPPKPAALAAAVEAKPAAKPPATVHMQISAVPAHARMTLDGAPIPNPFEADVVKGGKHRVEAHADGHKSGDVTVRFDRDRELSVKLDPIAPAAPPRAAAPRPKAKKRVARASPPPAEATPLPKPAKPATPAPSPTRGAGFVSESPY